MCDRFNDFFISLTIPSIESYDHSFSALTKQFIVFPLDFDIFMTTVLYLMDASAWLGFREERQKLIHSKIYYVASNRLSFFSFFVQLNFCPEEWNRPFSHEYDSFH